MDLIPSFLYQTDGDEFAILHIVRIFASKRHKAIEEVK